MYRAGGSGRTAGVLSLILLAAFVVLVAWCFVGCAIPDTNTHAKPVCASLQTGVSDFNATI